jgi:hypothetical protein
MALGRTQKLPQVRVHDALAERPFHGQANHRISHAVMHGGMRNKPPDFIRRSGRGKPMGAPSTARRWFVKFCELITGFFV